MNFEYFLEAPLVIQVHTLSALGALLVGVIQLARPKGRLVHRILGMGFVLLMITVASTAIFIREINNGSFSFIHIFVPLTFFGLFGLVREVRQGRIRAHRNSALSLFFAALMIPGVFAFMPGRLMWAIMAG